MRKITLNDGTEFEGSNCGLASGVVWCYLENTTFHQALAAFDDPEKTAKIDFFYGEMVSSYEGYTKIIVITVEDSENRVNVALVRPASQGVNTDA